jgi:hypothetical protein
LDKALDNRLIELAQPAHQERARDERYAAMDLVETVAAGEELAQDDRSPAISDPCKTTILIESLLCCNNFPVCVIQIDEHFVGHYETCRRMKPERPVKFEQFTKTQSRIASVILPALFKSRSGSEGP